MDEPMSRDSSPELQESDLEVADVLSQGETRLQQQQQALRSHSTPNRSGSGQQSAAYSPFRPATVLSNAPRNNTATVTPTFTKVQSLQQSAGRGEVSRLREYLAQGEATVDEVDRTGLTALMWASAYDQPEAAACLLEHGADVDALAPDHNMGLTALHLAASSGSTTILQMLLNRSRGSINVRTLDGCTPLLYATYREQRDCVAMLLEAGADVTIANAQGHTPLHLATVMGLKDITDTLNQYMLGILEPESS